MVLTLGGSTGMIRYSVHSILVRYVLTRVFVLFGVFPQWFVLWEIQESLCMNKEKRKRLLFFTSSGVLPCP